MKIHHLSCGSLCPFGGFLMDGSSRTLGTSLLSCHCLLIETDAHGLVLVDTGFGVEDIQSPLPRMSHFFLNVCRPSVNYFQTALAKVEALGFTAQDVRHIVLTHLDFDHAGGLDDFPEATVHVMRAEKRAAEYRRGFIPSRRYRPLQYRHHSLWKTYRPQGERWYGFEAVRSLEGLPPEILMVPLAGHTLGHAGVAVRSCGTDGADWLLHAGDAYFYRGEIKPEHPHCTPGLALYQWMMDTRRDWRIGNQKRLRALVRAHGDEIRVFCAHDQKEFEQLSGFATSGAQRQAA